MKISNNFSLPHSILSKLYDLTGTSTGGTKGFILAYVNSDGEPSILNKFENICVGMALKQTIEIFLSENEQDQ